MTDLNKLASLISTIDSIDDLRKVNEWVRAKASHLQRVSAHSFYKGMRVSFKSNKTGCIITGRVNRVNQKTLSIIAEDGTSWKVSASLVKSI